MSVPDTTTSAQSPSPAEAGRPEPATTPTQLPTRPPRRPGRGRRVATVLLVAALVATAGVGSWMAASRSGRASAASQATVPPAATATVTRGDLASTEEVDGTLGYGSGDTGTDTGAETKVNGTLPGRITKLPDAGATLKRGQELYELDGETPVTFMTGDRPAWRKLESGMSDGADVRQLEKNLKALGFDPDGEMTVDDDFTAATTDAIQRWQKSIGVDETGTIPLGQVQFLPWRSLRVASLSAQLGSPGTGAVMSVTDIARQVTAKLDANLAYLVHTGQTVKVELPSGKTTEATVTDVGTVASSSKSGDVTPGLEQESTVSVTAKLKDQKAAGRLDQAPVKVSIVTQSRKNVLQVPVTALLALAEGGYGVELVAPGGARALVPVQTGLFSADDKVEVSGGGVKEGDKVVTAQ